MYMAVMDKWDISEDRILRILTDNGSNVVSAFKDCVWTLVENKAALDTVALPALDPNLDESFLELDEKETSDYDHDELDLDNVFYRLKRLSCFAHNLMLAARAAVEDSAAAKGARKKALGLVATVCRSPKALESLRERTGGIGLVKPVLTRWIFWYYVFDRLLTVKRPLSDVCEELKIFHEMTPADWDLLSQMRDIFEPFAKAVTRLEGENHTTLSEVYPVLFSLKDKLNQFENSQQYHRVLPMIRRLKQNLESRFSRICKPTSLHFDPVYVLATYLDPRYALLLEGDLLETAKRELTLLAMNGYGARVLTADPNLTLVLEDPHAADDLLASVRAKVLERRRSDPTPAQGNDGALDIEQNIYASELKKGDPLIFWVKQQHALPVMSDVAFDVLSIPAATAPVERVFSRASYILSKKRHNLSDKSLELELCCKFNSEFLSM